MRDTRGRLGAMLPFARNARLLESRIPIISSRQHEILLSRAWPSLIRHIAQILRDK